MYNFKCVYIFSCLFTKIELRKLYSSQMHKPTRGQKYLVSELKPFLYTKKGLGHSVFSGYIIFNCLNLGKCYNYKVITVS